MDKSNINSVFIKHTFLKHFAFYNIKVVDTFPKGRNLNTGVIQQTVLPVNYR